ncbi:MAG: DUF2934 domain-containing protein [Alphaproteobacteria bacterium]|nr:DUF2934 domain-containing protein [Alphaproteobacteria bacterium]
MARTAHRVNGSARRPVIAGGPDLFEAKAPAPKKRRGAAPPEFGNPLPVEDDFVRRRAFELWQAAGRPQGPDLARWFEGVAPARKRRR